MVGILSWNCLKNTVPIAQKNADDAPNSTPTVDIEPDTPSTLTATIPENPSASPTTLAVESASPRINHASNPTSIGCR